MRYADSPTTDMKVYVDAPPDRVWGPVTDIHLMPGISNELMAVRWSDGVDGPCLGATFVGRNRHEALGEWETTSYVVDFERPKVFAWAVEDVERPAALWRFTLRPEGAGTIVTQWVRIGPGESGLNIVIDRMPHLEERIVANRLSVFRTGMTANLARIKELSEQPVA
ncbi:MAG TPA: SRPBCC family protein [Pseudonocardiaceae bacterium]|nr:SRPBCC family protein [Pseudonocardiaceae bacterium]